jgi:hypothetical protein
MLPIGEIVGAMFPRMVWDAGLWTPRGFMVSEKKARPFKLEVAWVKVVASIGSE